MDRKQAELERDRLAAEHPDATWLLHGDDAAGWSVARVGLTPTKPEGTALEAAEKPPPADTRTSVQQNTGGHYGF